MHGDCREVLAGYPPDHFDVICTDPPYGLHFMGAGWDHGVPDADHWREVLRVAKPGAYLTAFGGTRTYHRLTCAIEDAGWEIRDCLMWLYGTGFPKSFNVGKKVASHNGYGTALKPSYEPIILARKPLVGTVAQNVQRYGTGGLNIDGCRVEHASSADLAASQGKNPGRSDLVQSTCYGGGRPQQSVNTQDRWPPNVLLSHGPNCTETACGEGCPIAELDGQSGITKSSGGEPLSGEVNRYSIYGGRDRQRTGQGVGKGDIGGASRFFSRFHYCSKASRKERGPDNKHPTVKPIAVVRWLLSLTAPPVNGIVLDPFAGSGTTGLVAAECGLSFVGVESKRAYCKIAQRRLWAQARKEHKR